LLQGKNSPEFNFAYPEIETQLKQLYTAITRCSYNFYFCETAISDAGGAFSRLLKERELAYKRDQVDVEKIVKTPDQWNTTGINYAMVAETSGDIDKIIFWLDKASYCFKRSESEELQRKARTHRDSVTFRQEYAAGVPEQDEEEEGPSLFTTTAASHLESLLREGLLLEASYLCGFIMPLVDTYARERLSKSVVPTLPDLERLER
jgi:hypothetical protein